MKNKEITSYKVITWDINRDKVAYYDVIPYLKRCWDQLVERGDKTPETFEEFRTFVDNECKYQFWSRCEYESIVSSWPPSDNTVKIDVYQQIKENLDIVTDIFMNTVYDSLESRISNGEWISFDEVHPSDIGLDWVLVQFVENNTGFASIPYVAEWRKSYWNFQFDDMCHAEYLNEHCHPASWKIIEHSPQYKENN